jgi:anthranilate/para-aminobenzoate synthase component I
MKMLACALYRSLTPSVCCRSWSPSADEREAMFFGGLFAYDLVAGFENLPPLESDTACPDYCFYLAETLLVIDIRPKIPAFSRACSPRWKMKNSVWYSELPSFASSLTSRLRRCR